MIGVWSFMWYKRLDLSISYYIFGYIIYVGKCNLIRNGVVLVCILISYVYIYCKYNVYFGYS